MTTRDRCRLCGSPQVREFVRFPDMPFTDEMLAPARAGQEFRADIAVYWCEACRAAMTLHDVDVRDYYRDYQYTVSGSMFARRFMERLAAAVWARWRFPAGSRVVEIGSGDGYQLACFRRLGAQVLGFEPSAELAQVATANGVPTACTLFNCQGAAQIPAAMRPAQVVLLTYTFDHLPDPRAFLDLARQVLDPSRGVLVIEVHDFEKIVERREICLFEHEHTIYLTQRSLRSLRRLLESAGFRVVARDLLPPSSRRGNSLLVAAAPATAEYPDAEEAASPLATALESWPRVQRFASETDAGIRRFRDRLREWQAAGRVVGGYGAGGRGVMTLAMTGTDASAVCFLCDQNTAFHGLYTPATHIPVVAPGFPNEHAADEIIVFSYAYMDEIRERMKPFLLRGGALTSLLDIL